MKKVLYKVVSSVLILSFVLMSIGTVQSHAKSSKTITLKVGKKKTLYILNGNKAKRIKWSVKNPKVVKLLKKGKKKIVIKALKKGKTVITGKAYIKKKIKKLKITVKVTGKKKKKNTVVKPTATPKITVKPTIKPVVTNSPVIPSKEPLSTAAPTPTLAPEPTIEPTASPELVEDIIIDTTQLENTTLTSPGGINFSSQLDERFDLKYFSKMVVYYSYHFEEDAALDFATIKISLVDSLESLNGYSEGVALTYNNPMYRSAEVNLEDCTGNAVGINIQPMNSSYNWPEKLTDFTVTSIRFVAKENVYYPYEVDLSNIEEQFSYVDATYKNGMLEIPFDTNNQRLFIDLEKAENLSMYNAVEITAFTPTQLGFSIFSSSFSTTIESWWVTALFNAYPFYNGSCANRLDTGEATGGMAFETFRISIGEVDLSDVMYLSIARNRMPGEGYENMTTKVKSIKFYNE